jgi:hypothetical protein
MAPPDRSTIRIGISIGIDIELSISISTPIPTRKTWIRKGAEMMPPRDSFGSVRPGLPYFMFAARRSASGRASLPFFRFAKPPT